MQPAGHTYVEMGNDWHAGLSAAARALDLSARHDPTKARRSDPRTTLGRSLWICWPTKVTRRKTPIPVAIETGRGLLVACLHATGRVPSMPYPGKTSHRRLAESKSVSPQGKTSNRWIGCDRPIGNPQVAGSSPARPTA